MLFQKGRIFVEKAEMTTRILEKEFVWEGLPLVTLHLTLPCLTAHSPAAARINAYYQSVEKALVRDAQKRLLPIAAARYRLDTQNSAPLQLYTVQMSFSADWNDAGLLSFYFERQERFGSRPALTAGYADVWDINTGRPVSLRKWRQKLMRAVRRMASEQAALQRFPYYGQLKRRIKAYGDACQTGLSPEGVRVFFPQTTLSPPAAGIVSFTVPYEAVGGAPSAHIPPRKNKPPRWQGLVKAREICYNTKIVY